MPWLIFFLAFCGVLGCFSAVFSFLSVFVDPVSVCLLDLVLSLNDYSHDFVDPRLLSFHHHSELSDSAVFPVEVVNKLLLLTACEDERWLSRSRDLDRCLCHSPCGG